MIGDIHRSDALRPVGCAAALMAACVPDLSGVEANVRCAMSAQCPVGWVCNAELGLCLPPAGDDTTPPLLVGPVSFRPSLAGVGTDIEIAFSVDEALAAPPRVLLQTPAGELSVAVSEAAENDFVASHAVDGTESEAAAITIVVFDRVGNRGAYDAGVLPLDLTPPALANAGWENDRTALGLMTRVSFSGQSEAGVAVDAARVVDEAGGVVADLAVSVTTAVVGVTTVSQILGVLDVATLPSTGLAGAATLSVEVVLTDPIGNSSSPSATRWPALSLDTSAPETVIDAGPPVDAGDYGATFVFSSPDTSVSDWECDLDGGGFLPCTNPHDIEVATTGPHTLAVRAVDAAGNADPTPALHAWGVRLRWRAMTMGVSSVALTSDGRLFSFGSGGAAALSTFTDWRVLSLASPTCAIRGPVASSELWCWGEVPGTGTLPGTTFHSPQPVSSGWRAIGSSRDGRCGIKDDGALWCWGDEGIDGQGALVPAYVPQRVGLATDWLRVEVGAKQACGIRQSGTDRTLWCWGVDSPMAAPAPAQLPGNDWLAIHVLNEGWGLQGPAGGAALWTWDASAPILVGGSSLTRLAGNCVWDASGALSCWDDSTMAFIPGPPGVPAGSGLATADGWAWIEQYGFSNCGLRDIGELWCWGSNAFGLLGGSTRSDFVPTPTGVQSTRDHVALSPPCAVRDDSQIECWGLTSNDPLGGDPGLPAVRAYGVDWLEVDGTCGLRVNGPDMEAWCWGGDSKCGWGDGLPCSGSAGAPVQVGDAGTTFVDWVALHSEREFTVGIRDSGGNRTLWWWGDPQLWGTQTAVLTELLANTSGGPVAATDWTEADTSVLGGCAIRDGAGARSLWCFGRGVILGRADSLEVQDLPTQVGEGEVYETDWVDVAVGSNHGCGIREVGMDRTLWCWGYVSDGRLGVVPTNPAHLIISPPVEVGGTDWLALSAGGGHTCGLRTGGSVWCWGGSDNGQAGGVAPGSVAVPTPIDPSTAWTSVRAGQATTCALKVDGSTWCWGDNRLGELGDGEAFGPVEVVLP